MIQAKCDIVTPVSIEQAFECGRTRGYEQGMSKGLEFGITQGLNRGAYEKMRSQIHIKLARNKTLAQIADEMEISVAEASRFIEEMKY